MSHIMLLLLLNQCHYGSFTCTDVSIDTQSLQLYVLSQGNVVKRLIAQDLMTRITVDNLTAQMNPFQVKRVLINEANLLALKYLVNVFI